MQVAEITLNDAPEQFWDITQESGPASVFYDSKLLTLWQECYGWSGVVLAANQSWLPGFVKKSVAGSAFWSLPFGWYGGVFSELPDDKATEALYQHLTSSGYSEISVVQFGSTQVAAAVPTLRCNQLTTHILDLSNPPAYADNTRRNLEKARAAELEVAELQAAEIEAAIVLLLEHERLTGKPRKIKAEFYRRLLESAAGGSGSVKTVGAKSGDRLVACHIYLQSAGDIFYLDGFSNEAGRELSANFLLFDYMIDDAKIRALQRFNFGASPAGDEGLRRFKEGWGAQPQSYVEYYCAGGLKRLADKLRGRR